MEPTRSCARGIPATVRGPTSTEDTLLHARLLQTLESVGDFTRNYIESVIRTRSLPLIAALLEKFETNRGSYNFNEEDRTQMVGLNDAKVNEALLALEQRKNRN
ncbi:unnamed protein product [Amoebophrya sp. A25]|nr:unnamed protein product [Amoebophrya sp. A25]|eukprot:GSA25T00001833001.1